MCQPEVLSQLEDLQSMLSQHTGSSDSLGFLQALLQFQLGMQGDKPKDPEKVSLLFFERPRQKILIAVLQRCSSTTPHDRGTPQSF